MRAILRKTEETMWGVELIDKRNTHVLILGKDSDDILGKALHFKVL